MMLCVYIEVVRVANDHLNCLEVEVGVTLVGALAPSAHYTHKCGFENVTQLADTATQPYSVTSTRKKIQLTVYGYLKIQGSTMN
jgi:hypothetical protein